ncbi:MAG TPA: hypothetical protein VN428_11145 [Bryobacteraceae bacterium]|nr:hypothetical protein [Bryobacteraceae bacterium]
MNLRVRWFSAAPALLLAALLQSQETASELLRSSVPAAPWGDSAGGPRAAVLVVAFLGITPPPLSPAASHASRAFPSGSQGQRPQEHARTAPEGDSDIFGRFNLGAAYGCDESYELRDAAIAAAEPQVDLTRYKGLLVFPPDCASADLRSPGWAALISASPCARDCVPSDSARDASDVCGAAMVSVEVGGGAAAATDSESDQYQAALAAPSTPAAIVTGEKTTSQSAVSTTVSVRQFGAKGNGIADDYSAMKAAAEYICKVPSGTLVYPPGVYRIRRYRILSGPRRNDVANIRYNGCNAVRIVGPGAKIDVAGSFHRSADVVQGPYAISYSVGVIPFEMLNSSNFTIAGFELDGNVDEMTRDPGVIEGGNAGILTTNCKNYSIEDVNVHHFHTDGITLGGNSTIGDQGALLKNVTAASNARQGLSIVQLRTATILDSRFLSTGKTGGYGYHEPAAGVDVEPQRIPPAEDVRTGLLSFERCRFEENRGPQFISTWPDRVETISVKDSYVKATLPDASPVAFLSVPANGVVSGTTFDLGLRNSVALAPVKKDLYPHIVKLTYTGNTFNLQNKQGIAAAVEQAPVDFLANSVRVVSSAQDTSILGLYYLDRVEANTFFFAGSGYLGATGSEPWAIVYAKVKSIQRNVYSTDLSGSRQYKTVYYGSGMTVAGETFQPVANFVPLKYVQ